jgi:hypothetical protein
MLGGEGIWLLKFQYHAGLSLKLMLIYIFVFSVIDGNGMFNTLMVTSFFHCPN